MSKQRPWLWLAFWLLLAPAAPADCPAPEPARELRAAGANEIMLASLNLWRLRDTRKDARHDRPLERETLDQRLDALALHIIRTLARPHLLAIQEVENRSLLKQLVRRIREAGGPAYRVYLEEGHDPSGIDVGLLVRDPVRVARTRQLFAREKAAAGYPLFSRPPLLAVISEPWPLELVVVHLRSGHDLHEPRVRARRRRQAQLLRGWALQRHGEGRPVVIAGDLNSAGDDAFGEPRRLLAQPPMHSVWQYLPAAQRYSHVFRCRRQAIDDLLHNPSVAGKVSGAGVTRGEAGRYRALHGDEGTGEVVTDHDAPALYLRRR